jgi:hypothetical protein
MAGEEMLIVADAGEIIWLWPMRISGQAKITGQTRKIVQKQIAVMSEQ